MSGRNRAGGATPQVGQDVSGNGFAGRHTATAKGAVEATTVNRSGGKRGSGGSKPAGATSTGAEQKGSRTKGGTRSPAGRTSGGGSRRSGTASKASTAEVAERLPVRGDEEQWSPEELEEVRSELEQEVAGLRREIERAESEIAERLGDPSDGAGDDQADTGAKTFEREHEMSLANNARDLLTQNELAIRRIEAGTYGVCEGCGNPVGKARLQAFPRAALCVTCKQREERR